MHDIQGTWCTFSQSPCRRCSVEVIPSAQNTSSALLVTEMIGNGNQKVTEGHKGFKPPNRLFQFGLFLMCAARSSQSDC